MVKQPIQGHMLRKMEETFPPLIRLMEGSTAAWKQIWERADIQLEGDRLAQKLIRMHIYHLMVTTSPHNKRY
jgi:trehalose/maltose hydrolase-like predicted phosphorylase